MRGTISTLPVTCFSGSWPVAIAIGVGASTTASQDLWQVIVERISRYDPERGTFPTWLSTVVRNAMTDQDRASHAPGHLDDELERRLPSREIEPPTACEQTEARTAVKSAIEAVRSKTSETTYRIVHDHWIEGKPYNQIAADLGLTVKQVRDRHHRAVGILRAILARRK
jgi:RNA polymerase sigma factor (sigma-70 family)